MLSLKNMPQLLQQSFMDFLFRTMEDLFPDYAALRERKDDALGQLAEMLAESTLSVGADEAAATQQLASTVLFSALLGLKANLDNYIDPVRQCFLDVDAEIYLREEMAHRLPDYSHAEALRNRFYNALTPEQQCVYEPVQDYVCYLETIAPKLAHYCGYILGNALFPKVVPAYTPDQAQTIRYRLFLSRYFNCQILF